MANGNGNGIKRLAQTDGFKWLHLGLTVLVFPMALMIYQDVRGDIQANTHRVERNSVAVVRLEQQVTTLEGADPALARVLEDLRRELQEANQRLARLEEWAKGQGR